MKRENKQILLQDLSARLPYRVYVDYSHNAYDVHKGNYVKHGSKCILDCYLLGTFMAPRQNEEGEYIKPYLRSMSSMTEEELEEYHSHCFEEEREEFEYGEWIIKVYYHDTIYSIDWLNAHHFDYRELIPKDLAIEVTKENNPYYTIKL